MEEREKSYILKYLPQLIQWTVCDVRLLESLQKKGILTATEFQSLKASGRKADNAFQAYQLYQLVLVKPHSFDIFLSTLFELNQSRPAKILSDGKARNFDSDLGEDEMVEASKKFTLPPDGFRDLFENEKLPVLVISTEDITMTTQRIQAEKIKHQNHLFRGRVQLTQAFDTLRKETALLIVMYGKKRKALVDVLQEIRDKMATDDRRQCIVVTTEGKEVVAEVIQEFNSSSTYKFCDFINDDLKWNQLSREFQSNLMGSLVKFQDQEMTLTDLLCSCNENERQTLLEKLETKLLVQLVNDEKPVFCNNTLSQRPTPHFYIRRKIISRGCAISDEILQNGNSRPNTSFAITGMMRPRLVNLMAGSVSKSEEQIRPRSRTALGITAKFILLDMHEHFGVLCNKINPETTPVKNLHWLNFNKERGHLEWVRSFGEPGCLSLIQQYLLPMADKKESYCITEQDFVIELVHQETENFINRPAICISDHPGMGKTTLMAHIGEQLLTKVRGQSTSPSPHPKFVQYFVMTELMRDLEDKGIWEERKLTKAIILEILLKRITETEVIRHLFQKSGTKCELMLDGFDEVLPHQANLAVKFISVLRQEFTRMETGPTFRLWLTTRSIYLQLVEQTLGVLGYNLLPFDENDQKKFLKMYWTQAAGQRNICLDPEKLETFAQGTLKMMKRLNKKLSQFETEMTGIPLQCLLLGQVTEDSMNYECSVDGNVADGAYNVEEEDPERLGIKNMADLYSRVIDKKLEIFLNRESSNFHLESHLSKNNKEVMKRIHMKLALELLFPDCAKEFDVAFLYESNISPEELSVYGFITEYSTKNQPFFLHRTYAEYFVALFAVEFGTCERFIEGFRVTDQMARFYLEGILATRPEMLEISHPDYPELATFQMPVVTYFIEEMLEMRMAEEQIPRCLLKSVQKNLDEIAPSGKVDMKTSKILVCMTNDRPSLCKLLVDSLGENGKQVWVEKSKELHANMVNAVALRGNKEGLKILCELLGHCDNQQISELPYQRMNNPVRSAVATGNVESVEYLVLEKGFKPEVWGSPQFGILHQCVKLTDENNERDIERRKNIIHFLVESQRPVTNDKTSILEHVDILGRTPLLAKQVHISLRMILIQAGANIDVYDEGGNQVLHMLGDFRGITSEIYHEFIELIEIVVQERISDPEERGWIFGNTGGEWSTGHIHTPNWHWGQDTPLHLAVGHLEVLDDTLDLFQRYDFNWNMENGDGYTVVHIAVKYGRSMRLIQKLIELGADWTVTNNEGRTAFHEAAWVGHADFLRWICSSECPDFDINFCDHNKRTALHYGMLAPEEKRRETVEILMENGADPNLLNYARKTPLIQSLNSGQGIDVELLNYLKVKGAYVLGNDEDDKVTVITTLYSKANVELDKKWDLGQVVEYLVSEGADLRGRLKNKKNLVHRAAGNGWVKGLQLLERHLGKEEFLQLATEQDDNGCTPIYRAIKSKRGRSTEVLKWLVSRIGENVAREICGEGGVRPLHVCAEVGWLEGMELLLDKYGVDVTGRDDEGNTALHMAHCTDWITEHVVGYLHERMEEIARAVKNDMDETPEEYGQRRIKEIGQGVSDFVQDFLK